VTRKWRADVALVYVNRKGETYYLLPTKGRSGKWHFARHSGPGAAEALPSGYEPWERPENGQVVVRKIKPTRITPLERRLVENAIAAQAALRHSIVDVDGDAMVVYLPNIDDGKTDELLAGTHAADDGERHVRDEMVRRSRYAPMMRFVLLDGELRLFSCERWCFLGGIDDWYFLAGERALAELVDRYVPHLGKESFFELH
jgi:hypothetical protein